MSNVASLSPAVTLSPTLTKTSLTVATAPTLYSLVVPAETVPVALTDSLISPVPIVVSETVSFLFDFAETPITVPIIAITKTMEIAAIIFFLLLFFTVAISYTSIYNIITVKKGHKKPVPPLMPL